MPVPPPVLLQALPHLAVRRPHARRAAHEGPDGGRVAVRRVEDEQVGRAAGRPLEADDGHGVARVLEVHGREVRGADLGPAVAVAVCAVCAGREVAFYGVRELFPRGLAVVVLECLYGAAARCFRTCPWGKTKQKTRGGSVKEG